MAAVATAVIGVIMANSFFSINTWAFIGWAISPYAYLILMMTLVLRPLSFILIMFLTLLVSGIGVWAFVEVLFINPDAQSGLAFMVVPAWQWFVLLLATLPVYLLRKF
jgi:hypothetical protein